jgi:hypothetical protein
MRRVLTIAFAVAATAAFLSVAFAHDTWISRGQLKNPAGEWCCGEGDCFVVNPVHETGSGYELVNGEFVPFSETQPSPDGAFWRCKRPDGSRRCFFAPPPGS